MQTDIKNGKVARPYLGLYGLDQQMAARFGMKLNVEGIYVYKVVAGGPLDRAGIQHGDIILKIGDDAVKDFSAMQHAMDSHQVGDTVTVTYTRGGSQQTADVVLQESPQTDSDDDQ